MAASLVERKVELMVAYSVEMMADKKAENLVDWKVA